MQEPNNQSMRVVVIALFLIIIVFFVAYELQHP